MEKNNRVGYTRPYSFNLSLAMKLTTILLILSIFTVQANSYSQKTKLTLNLERVPMQKVFEEIESLTDFKFLYDNKKIDAEKLVSVKVKHRTISEILDNLFKDTSIYYLVRHKQIVLKIHPTAIPAKSKEESVIIEELKLPQNIVKGTITDDKGQPLPGANIVEKGTTNGVTADFNGSFSITLTEESPILIISYIGFSTQEIAVDGQTELYISLKEDSASLDEVVVIGYGTQSKRNVTGSISKVDMETTENLPITNITQSVRGRVAGVQFTDNGRPGQNGTMLIRGPLSLSGDNSPLIILDGIFFNGSMADVNPNDIESLEILKDASATAIYGSRAANGVILITSKKGITDKPTIRINHFSGISEWSKKVQLLTPERYIQKTLDARTQFGREGDPDKITEYLTFSEAENYRNGVITDPWDEISQFSNINSVDLNLSGKTDLTNYFLSFAAINEKGLILNDNQKRISARVNIENKVTDWLTIGTNATFVKRDLSGNPADPDTAYHASPFGTWYHENGEPKMQGYVDEDNLFSNAVWTATKTENEEIYHNLFANFYGIIDIPFIKGLKYRFNYSPNYRWQHNYNFVPINTNIDSNTSSARKFNRQDFDWVVENILTYNKQINENHGFDITLLYGRNHFGWESTTAKAVQLSMDFSGWNNLAVGNVLTNESSASATDGISSMVRLNYRLKNKYLLTLTARRDASSVFAANNKYSTFPSGAFAWIVSDEPFMKNISFVDNVKFRVSHGSVGNQAINPYQSLTMVSSSPLYVFGNSGSSSIGSIPNNLGNPDLKWETTYSSNIGMDFELFKGRLSGAIEYYDMKTEDLLVRRSLPFASGYRSVLANLGATTNKGVEVTLNTQNVKNTNFEWNSNLVFSTNKNRIEHLYRSDVDGDGKEDDDIGNGWLIGQPINIAYDFVFDGIYQEGEELPPGHQPGYAKFKDLNGDGSVDPANDRTVLGQTGEPKVRLGIGNTFRYKNISLSFFVNSMLGWLSEFPGYRPAYRFGTLRPWNFFDSQWWTPENRSNERPSFTYDNPLGHEFHESRDFVRLQDVSLSYDFESNTLKKSGIQNLRLYLSGRNLITLTKWPGTDPETGGLHNEFPVPRTVSVGFNIEF
ncbi:SusC/RagA family TonB-linked outer membrane protein [Arenibacter aquaticus]|uniref:SusC/RagA family TonB-linked outer membrane protein n=1 Tax=Arenibacter aquaticus TaxID=2489054 RepID=A0A430K8Q9_9FLAO|nr:TonB-dependent receptor [Arenibacter aquaticus]RTE55382.1 SusC/RagA family TonB-linked outer membrane protein [Arenibacter aquaticus]